MNTVGYLSTFYTTLTTTTTTLVDGAPGTALSAIGLVQNTSIAAIKTYVLPSGAKVDYDGTADAAITPGKATQDILCKTGGETLYAALVAKLGKHGTLTLTKSVGGTLTANARLEMVRDITPYKTHGTAEMRISATFELVGAWS